MVGRVGSTTSDAGSTDAIEVSSASTTSWSGNDTRFPEKSATLTASSTLSAPASSILRGLRCIGRCEVRQVNVTHIKLQRGDILRF